MDIDQCSPGWLAEHVIPVPRGDRWLISQRLQELDIPCVCPADGSLRVIAENPTAICQIRSVLHQFMAPRTQLVPWLEQCWNV